MLIISLTHTRNQLQCILVAASVCFSFNCRGIQEKAITIQEDEEYESTLKLIKKIRKEKWVRRDSLCVFKKPSHHRHHLPTSLGSLHSKGGNSYIIISIIFLGAILRFQHFSLWISSYQFRRIESELIEFYLPHFYNHLVYLFCCFLSVISYSNSCNNNYLHFLFVYNVSKFNRLQVKSSKRKIIIILSFISLLRHYHLSSPSWSSVYWSNYSLFSLFMALITFHH